MSRRTTFTLPGRDGHALAQLTKSGELLLTSSVTGVDPATGDLSPEPERQFEGAFHNLERLLERAGVGPDDIGLITVNIPGQDFRPYINKPWLALFPDEDNRPARKTNQYPLPGGQLVQLQAFGIAGRRRQRLEIPGWSHRDPLPAGCRIGDLIFSSVVTAQQPGTGNQAEDAKAQMDQAFKNVETLLAQAGAASDHLLHMYVFLRDRADQPALIDVWLERFPAGGDRPARKTIFYDELKGRSSAVQVQFVAVAGQGRRRNFEIPGVGHHDPIPMACALGPVLWSSGISGRPVGDDSAKGVTEQSAFAFSSLRELMTQAGGTIDDVALLTIMVKDYADQPAIMAEWRRMFPDESSQPARHTMALGAPGNNLVQLHVVATVPA